MAKKKTAAQIRRMQMRAEKRGEEYEPPEPTPAEKATENSQKEKTTNDSSSSNTNKKMLHAAQKLKKELTEIQNNEQLRAKERRSQKRKAEAVAAEEAGCSAEEMQKWYEENQDLLNKVETKNPKKKTSKDGEENQDQKHSTPYIVFVGQLAYTTTKEALWGHIHKELSAEHKITEENVKVRLLTDAKTKKSRGMAFVELSDPELMYACLKLHHTLLECRRLNVERSAGGRKKETRQAKIKQFREQQEEYLSNVIDSIIGDYVKTGELQEGELDEGAVAMCKRYSASMVETAIKQYIENNGRTMDNTSAYFSFLLGKLAADKAEGVSEGKGKENSKDRPSKRPKSDRSSDKDKSNKKVATQSSLPGVNFSMSEKDGSGGELNLKEIFPSLSRRGRGRGYM